MKKYIFPLIIALSALTVSASAAYYSVFGLSHLFSGAGLAIIIMASSLEASKLVVASLLHQYWNRINLLLKSYLIVALLTLIVITSAGIYGFLTNAYQLTSAKSQVADSQIVIVENKKAYFSENIGRIESQIGSKNTRITTLTNLRSQQETRLDSLYNKGWYSSARKTEKLIKEANEDIKYLEADVDTLNTKINALNDSINNINLGVLDIQTSNEAASELGPLKYLAELLDKPMDVVINWLMLILIFVFDPLAIALVLAANTAFDHARNKVVEPKKKRRKWFLYGEKKKKTKSEPKIDSVKEEIKEEPKEVPSTPPKDKGSQSDDRYAVRK